MPNETNDPLPRVNHIFVDYENVHAVDPAIIGSKTVHVTLLLGEQATYAGERRVQRVETFSTTADCR